MHLARIGRPDILWSVNKLARPVTKWTQSCDGRLARLISYIHHTNDFRQCCHVGFTAQHCRLRLFQDSDVAGDLEDSKSTSGGVLCIFGSRTFVPVSWMCKTQTSVSHSSTESEIVSLDAGLRMALDLRDEVTEVLRSTNSTVQPNNDGIQETGATLHSKTKIQNVKRKHKVEQWSDVDYVPRNTHSSQCVYIFEDNEAVIKMIIKGRSPTMRHASRTHRVARDWLFDRIKLEPRIQIKYVDTKNQLADILTKGSFSRDEWNDLLRLFNNMSFSMYSCSHFSDFLLDDQVRKQSAMSKKGQKTTSNEGSPKAKARPCMVARDPRSEELSSRSLGSLVNPENTDERKEVETAAGNSVRSASRSEVGYSQVSRQENVPIAAGNSMREDQHQTHSDERKHSSSNSTRRRVASKPELRNMEYTNRQYMSKIFQQYTNRLLNGSNLILHKTKTSHETGEKFVKILGTIAQSKSCIHRQRDGIRESMCFNTSSIRDMWHR